MSKSKTKKNISHTNGGGSHRKYDITINRVILAAFMIVGVIVRLYRFGSVPGGINQDEAFAGYEAYSMLHSGMDSFGYHLPVYLTTWGSGMNALESYLMIPFIAIFGLKTWVIRMPQVIVAILTMPVCYMTMKKLFDEKVALIALIILAVAPWHIMLARWGLESNLAPGFLMFGFYFFICGMDKSRYYIVSAVMYGLSLYCYATIWPFVPLMIVLQIVYAIWRKQIKIERNTIISVVVLGVLALPLLLFILVNTDHIAEIKTSFISIPKLLYFRSGELSLSNIGTNFNNIWNIMINQSDGLVTNVCEGYGIFYKITLMFFAVGLVTSVINIFKTIKSGEGSGRLLIFIQFLGGFILSLMVTVNINRANSLMIPMILIAALGVYDIVKLVEERLIWIVAIAYVLQFASFAGYYFSNYNEISSAAFCSGLEEAVDSAMSRDGTIYITSSVAQSRVMFYSQISTEEYINSVVYNNYPGAFVGTDSFGRFVMNFDINSGVDINGTYVLDAATDTTVLVNAGFTMQTYGNYVVAWHE